MSENGQGLYIRGEFIGYRERKPRTVGNRTFTNVDVGLKVLGAGILTVQYQSRAAAEYAVGAAALGDVIDLPVRNEHGVKDGRGWQFYAGVAGEGSSEAFAGEFEA